jgi:hypothetical protein
LFDEICASPISPDAKWHSACAYIAAIITARSFIAIDGRNQPT